MPSGIVIFLLSILSTLDSSSVELIGPQEFFALGGSDLVIRFRPFNFSTPPLFVFELRDVAGEFLASQNSSEILNEEWKEVTFDCGLFVRSGSYKISLTSSDQLLQTLDLDVSNPPIDFEVPHRLETFTASVPLSFGFTRSHCTPQVPLPPSELLLVHCDPFSEEPCGKLKTFASLYDEPLRALEGEGRLTVNVECHFWSRNGTFLVEIREKGTGVPLARSQQITVEWSGKFSVVYKKQSIVPCRKFVRVSVAHPTCILRGRDRVRVFAHEPLPVPSLLAPNRVSYIGEREIKAGRRSIAFPCNLFSQRYSQYCFQYISTGVDGSVSAVVETCIPTFSSPLSQGGWGDWSHWSPCSLSCGDGGKQFRYRLCDSPHPSFGSNFCQGDSIEEQTCSQIPPCIEEVEEKVELTVPSVSIEDYLKRNGTGGCECGCKLGDIPPSSNSSLVFLFSSNHSACEDEDEEEHHQLRWILQAAEGRVELKVLHLASQCIRMSFRDGEPPDSNLLQVASSGGEVQLWNDLDVRSTGPAISIMASESATNCSNHFLFFAAEYVVLVEQKPQAVVEFGGEFWVFLFCKLTFLVFVGLSIASLTGGCAAKFYRNYKYKQLALVEAEDHDSESTVTALTILPFDYAHFRRLHFLRLRRFLLTPKVLKENKIRSFPTTPTRAGQRKWKPLDANSNPQLQQGTEKTQMESSQTEKTIANEKERKEKENEKRREKGDYEKRFEMKRNSNSTINSSGKFSSCGSRSERSEGREFEDDADHDFEMDYYDYDVVNAGTIPGSYLGLEPAFVVWNSEMGQDLSEGIEMSSGHESQEKARILVKETSLDTLRFVDEEDDHESQTEV